MPAGLGGACRRGSPPLEPRREDKDDRDGDSDQRHDDLERPVALILAATAGSRSLVSRLARVRVLSLTLVVEVIDLGGHERDPSEDPALARSVRYLELVAAPWE